MKIIIIASALFFLASMSHAQKGLKFGIQGELPFNDFNKDVRAVFRSQCWLHLGTWRSG
jgi:hypothetical protein